MPDITFFHKTRLDDHFPVVDLYRKSTKFDEPKAFFLTRTIKTPGQHVVNNGTFWSLLFLFLSIVERLTRDFEGRLWDEFSLWLFPSWKPFEVTDERKKTEVFRAELFRVFRVILAPCFGYLFVKTSSAPHSCNTLIKARGQRERDASVCCCSYQ